MCKVKRRWLYLLSKHFLDSVILQVLKLIYVSQLNDSFSNGSNSRSLCALSVLLRRWRRLRPLRRFVGFKGGGRPSGIPPTLVLCLCKRVGFHASLYIFMYTFCQSLIGYSRRSQCETSFTLGPPRQATGVYATTTATATKTSLKKWICVASNFIVLIPSRLIRQMLANFFGVEF